MASPATTDEIGAPLSAAEPALVDGEASPTTVVGAPSRYSRYEGLIIGGVAVLVFLAIWQAIAFKRVYSELFLPGPLDIYNAFVSLFQDGGIWNDMRVSGQELIIGYVLAILFGLPVGILMGWYRRLNQALDPFVNFFYSTPRIALVPLFIIWFGIGINSKIAVIFLGAVFPIMINTMAGVRNVDSNFVKAARSFGASDTQLFRTVILPGSVPFILAGLRLGVGHALIGVVVGELVAAQAGIGLMMATAGATFQTAKVFAGLIIIACTGMLLTAILQRIENRFQSWKPALR